MGWSLTQATADLCATREVRGGVFQLSQEDLARLDEFERRERRRRTVLRRWEDRKFYRWRRDNPLPVLDLPPVDHTATTMAYARTAWKLGDDKPDTYFSGGSLCFTRDTFINPWGHDGSPATPAERKAMASKRNAILHDMRNAGC